MPGTQQRKTKRLNLANERALRQQAEAGNEQLRQQLLANTTESQRGGGYLNNPIVRPDTRCWDWDCACGRLLPASAPFGASRNVLKLQPRQVQHNPGSQLPAPPPSSRRHTTFKTYRPAGAQRSRSNNPQHSRHHNKSWRLRNAWRPIQKWRLNRCCGPLTPRSRHS